MKYVPTREQLLNTENFTPSVVGHLRHGVLQCLEGHQKNFRKNAACKVSTNARNDTGKARGEPSLVECLILYNTK